MRTSGYVGLDDFAKCKGHKYMCVMHSGVGSAVHFNRLILMIGRQIESQLDAFRVEGGFTEGLTAERLSYRKEQSVQADAPTCPLCGKPMIKRVAKKGVNSGKEFWSCCGYPECNGTRRISG